MQDAPAWRMDRKALAHVNHHAPDLREHLAGIMEGLETMDVSWNDNMSFAFEVLAAQLNLLVDKAREHGRECSRPTLGDSELTNVLVSDIMNRALLRRLRGDDR